MINAVTLPYEKTLFTPVLSKETLDFHYDKHHLGYVNKLNGLIKDTGYADKSLEEIIKLSHTNNATAVYNNAAQIWNHDFYWRSIGQIKEKPADIFNHIQKAFGSFDDFYEKFVNAGITLFGSGWIWLVQDKETLKLSIVQTKNADNPLINGHIPLLTIDVWEHAYYIDYKNDRASYLKKILEYLQWNFAYTNMNIK